MFTAYEVSVSLLTSTVAPLARASSGAAASYRRGEAGRAAGAGRFSPRQAAGPRAGTRCCCRCRQCTKPVSVSRYLVTVPCDGRVAAITCTMSRSHHPSMPPPATPRLSPRGHHPAAIARLGQQVRCALSPGHVASPMPLFIRGALVERDWSSEDSERARLELIRGALVLSSELQSRSL